MFRLEIRKGWEVIKEYEGKHGDFLLELARADRWIDWYLGVDDDAVIKEDAWRYDGVDNVLLLEGDPDIYEEVVLKITKLENYESEEEAE
jgi:hypothetical protein